MHFNPKTLNPDIHFNPVESSNSNPHINFNPIGETPLLEKIRIQNSLLKRIKKKIIIENKKECEKEITLPEIVFEIINHQVMMVSQQNSIKLLLIF